MGGMGREKGCLRNLQLVQGGAVGGPEAGRGPGTWPQVPRPLWEATRFLHTKGAPASLTSAVMRTDELASPSVGADTDSVLRSPAQGRGGGQGRCSPGLGPWAQIPLPPAARPHLGHRVLLKTRWGEMSRAFGFMGEQGAHPSSTRVALAGFLDTLSLGFSTACSCGMKLLEAHRCPFSVGGVFS